MTFISEVNADSPILAWTTPTGTATAVDQSGNGRDGTVTGATNTTGPIPGFDALNFTADTHKVARADEAILDFGDTFTIEIIFKRARSSVAAGEALMHKGNNAPTVWFPGSGANNNRITLRKAAVDNVVEANVDITDTTTFHHIVAAKQGSTVRRLVLDRVDVTTDLGDETMANTVDELRVAQTVVAGLPFRGVIAFVGVYPTALSLARAQAHYDAIDDVGGGLTKSLADTMSVTDLPGERLTKGLADTLAATDDGIDKTVAYALADTASVTDAQSRVWVAARTVADTGTVTDHITLPGATNWTKNLGDTATVTDTQARVWHAVRALSDTAALSDAFASGSGTPIGWIENDDTVTVAEARPVVLKLT